MNETSAAPPQLVRGTGANLNPAPVAGGGSWAFTKPAPLPAPEPRPPQPSSPSTEATSPAGSCRTAEAVEQERRWLVESVRDLAARLLRLADGLTGPRTPLEPLLVDLAEVGVAVTRCCGLLEADTARHNSHAARRMVQASGLADALTVRLADTYIALQQRYDTGGATTA